MILESKETKLKGRNPICFCMFFCLFFCLFVVPVLAGKYIVTRKIPDVKIYENPKPTCKEKVYAELKKVGEVSDDLDSKAFLVKPCSIVADDEGNVFVMDLMFRKIYKYDKNLELIKTFGGKGEGPAEFKDAMGGGFSKIELYLGHDNLIYAGDRAGRKIVCFDRDGSLVKEFRLNVKPFAFINPVVDQKGNFYIHSKNGRVIDVFDRSGKMINSFLPLKVMAVGLFYKLKKPVNQFWEYGASLPGNVEFECMNDGRILVIVKSAGILYILKNGKVEKKFKLWTKQLLGFYKKALKIAIGDEDDKLEGFVPYFKKMIVDRDNPEYIYFRYGKPRGEEKNYLYQFDLNGKLNKVFYIKDTFGRGSTRIHYKRNGIFYAVGSDKSDNKTLMVFEEEVKK